MRTTHQPLSRDELQRRGTLPVMQISPGSTILHDIDDRPSPSIEQADFRPSKARKISRACDFCKLRKSKCTGDQPCSKCTAKGRTCAYTAQYTRGRPPTPPPSSVSVMPGGGGAGGGGPPSRASPELGMAEIQGQVFDPTSSMTFLHRAWRRLAAQSARTTATAVRTFADDQHITMAGDRPLPVADIGTVMDLPSPEENQTLLDLYFDVCIATYRILHRPSVKLWLSVVEANVRDGKPLWQGIGHAKAAIVLVALAIAKIHQEKSKGFTDEESESRAQAESDRLFGISVMLTDNEIGYPRLESAQARIVQTLYLLTTSRFNRSWFVFGSALQVISVIGLHRRETNKDRSRRGVAPKVAGDYIVAQCRLRTFWTAYVLDNYLGIIFGRPRHFHDQDIDQSFPDRVNDDDMTSLGPVDGYQDAEDYDIDALIFHAKIGQIIGSITMDVYTIKGSMSEKERSTVASRYIQQVHDWRSSLPAHLGLVRPSMLLPTHRRQATALRLAYCHAIMHASRLFILNTKQALDSDDSRVPYDKECITAARTVLETVDQLASEGPIFHAFWWTHYVTFCALVVTYVWEMQQRRTNGAGPKERDRRARLLALAEKCQEHLAQATATNSPSRRYAVILEEFRAAATSQPPALGHTMSRAVSMDQQLNGGLEGGAVNEGGLDSVEHQEYPSFDVPFLDGWRTTDWLDLDSSVSSYSALAVTLP